MRRLLLSYVVLTLAALTATAQVGRVTGKVLDLDGEPLQGVEVSLVDVESSASVSTETSKRGRFALAVRDYSRDYEVVLRLDGYQLIRESIRLIPNDPVIGEWTMEPGDSGGAVPGLDLSPEELEAKQAAVDQYNAGVKAYNEGDLEAAAVAFDAAIAEDPELQEAYDIASVLHIRTGNNERALELAKQILVTRPDEARALGVRYDALYALGREAEADSALDALVTKVIDGETAKRAYNRGLALARDSRFDDAVPRVEQALEIDPALVPAWGLLGDLEIGRGNFERAIEAGDALAAIEGSEERGLSLRHRACEGMGDKECAMAALRGLAELNPDAVINSRFERGQDLFDSNQPEEAAKLFREVVELQPDNGLAHYRLGLCLLSAGDTATARTHLERFLELEPEHPEAASARDMLGYIE